MNARLIQIFLPVSQRPHITELLAKFPQIEAWFHEVDGEQLSVRIFVDQRIAEDIVDQMSAQFDDVIAADKMRLILLDVEASIPNANTDPDQSLAEDLTPDLHTDLNPRSDRVNRIEIYDRVAAGATLSWTQLMMVLLSTTIAAIGVLRDNQAVVIGAMVIAPLLQPNMALAVATTLGDRRFALQTLLVGFSGIGLSLGFAILIGLLVPVDLNSSEIACRLRVDWPDGILAFASGTAGALSLTMEERSSLVGVMVAVALLPPLVVLGLLIGAGHWALALGTALLVGTNIICVNLAAVTTFVVQDLRPESWQAEAAADRLTGTAYGIWVGLLLGLVSMVIVAQSYNIAPYASMTP